VANIRFNVSKAFKAILPFVKEKVKMENDKNESGYFVEMKQNC